MEDRLRAVEQAIVGINTKLDTILPALATKENLAQSEGQLKAEILAVKVDLLESLNAQTWRFIGFVGLIAGLFFAAHKIWP